MLIALITQRESVDIHGTPIDYLESNYINFFESLGIELRIISNFHHDIKRLLKSSDYNLVILTGGGSVPTDSLSDNQRNRNFIEKEIVKDATNRNIPILAICRGMQYINTLYGGTVSRLNSLKVKRYIGKDHTVTMNNQESILVNNYHNDGIYINHLAEHFDIVALDENNKVIEAYYSKKYKILGFQWHPERNFIDKNSQLITKKIIQNFINNRGILDESYYFSSRPRN